MKLLQHLSDFWADVRSKSKTLIKFIGICAAEIFVVAGCFFVDFATFEINRTAGFYALGVILITAGIFFAMTKR